MKTVLQINILLYVLDIHNITNTNMIVKKLIKSGKKFGDAKHLPSICAYGNNILIHFAEHKKNLCEMML
jgi:hypothetical protein